jgi:hypothetical protein
MYLANLEVFLLCLLHSYVTVEEKEDSLFNEYKLKVCDGCGKVIVEEWMPSAGIWVTHDNVVLDEEDQKEVDLIYTPIAKREEFNFVKKWLNEGKS